MNIIILGCGKVGNTLAERLNEEGHEITLIDKDEEQLQYALDLLDVGGVVGNGTSYHVQMEAGIDKADLLIAATDHDEINLLSCLIAKKAGNCHTIARVRNPEYYAEINFIKEELGLSMSINPEWAAAAEISRLIKFPSAIEIDTFAKGKVDLIKIQIPEGSILHNMKIWEFSARIGRRVLICVVERNHEVFIPDGNMILKEKDEISVIIPPEDIGFFFKKVGIKVKPIKNVMIAGGGTICFYLAKLLMKSGISVKIIEANRERCEVLSENLPDAMILHGDAIERKLLLEEGICNVDAFASLTNMDEENIMLSLYANKVSNAKIITKINKISFGEVINDMPIGSIIYPKYLTAEYIVRYVRSMQNSMGCNVESLYMLMDNRVEALEFSVREKSRVTNISLESLNLKSNLLLCCINRGGKIITPSGQDVIRVGDTVIVVTTNKGLKDITDILA